MSSQLEWMAFRREVLRALAKRKGLAIRPSTLEAACEKQPEAGWQALKADRSWATWFWSRLGRG